MYRILTFLACTLMVVGCWKGPENLANMADDSLKPTSQRYYVQYYKAADSTKMGANLMPEKQPANGSSFYEIPEHNTILANGQPGWLGHSKITRQWAVTGLQDVEFTYSRREFRFVNHVRRSDIGDVDFDTTTPHSISLNDTTVFTCTASPLQAGEKLYMWFMKVNAPTAPESFAGIGQKVLDGSITLTPHDMQSVRPGTYKMYLKRERELPLQQPDHTASGHIVIELLTDERDVVFY